MFTRWGDYAAIPLRIVLGVVFVVHGAQKLFGLFGGDGLSGAATAMASYGLEPAMLWAVVAGIVQLAGGVALLLGFLTRWTALTLGVERLFVLFFANVGFTASGGGAEFSLVMLAALLALACTGAQRYALDERVPVLAEWSPPHEIKKAA
jgi:putative oxidoreductase